ncbi:hypothetical protein [Corynebacterium sp. 13CS0277]|nr:hypothetical protein [Corynebacterium sp. 13CS0277]
MRIIDLITRPGRLSTALGTNPTPTYPAPAYPAAPYPSPALF